MHRRFPSIEQPDKYGYAYESAAWSTDAPVNMHYRMFQTYGDGLVQHSHDWPITVEFFADYLASMAAAMLAEPMDAEETIANNAAYDFQRRPSVEAIAFASSVIWKQDPAVDVERYRTEKKRRYFSTELRKITTAPDKAHDKRYAEVEQWCDGSPEAIYRMLIGHYPKAQEMYATARAIRDWVNAQSGSYMIEPARFLKWREYADYDKARELENAWEAASSAVESYRLHHQTKRILESIRRQVERKKAEKAESETAA